MKATDTEIYHARMNLDRFVRTVAYRTRQELGFGWSPRSDAPATFEQLLAEYRRCSANRTPLTVSSKFCEDTIFFAPSANWAMRFWHDTLHARLEKSFERDDEYDVAETQLHVLRQSGFERSTIEYRLLSADSIGQTYCADQIGRFPSDQLQFALWCLEDGLEEAVSYEYAKRA